MDSHKLHYGTKNYDVYYPINNNSSVIKALIKNRIWERKLVDIFKEYIKPNNVVIDIGAYIGTHTILFSNIAKKVIAFEPQQLVGDCLRLTINENDMNNVILHRVALHKAEGELEFGTNNDGDASLKIHRKKKFNNNYFVKTKRLDDYELDKVDFIKIDTEGSEFAVLEGAKETIRIFKPIIVIEVFNTKKKMLQLEEFCFKNKYDYSNINNENYLLLPDEYLYRII